MKSQFSLMQRSTALLMLAAMLLSPIFAVSGASAQKMTNASATAAKSLTEDQKILHVLNRLGFGARPGDVERVRAIGLQRYIDQQLNPASLDDAAAEAKVRNLDVLRMSNEELFARYPNPASVLQAVGQQNGLDKADAKSLRNKNQVKGADGKSNQANGAMMADEKAMNNQNPAAMPELSEEERRRVRQQVAGKKFDDVFTRPDKRNRVETGIDDAFDDAFFLNVVTDQPDGKSRSDIRN